MAAAADRKYGDTILWCWIDEAGWQVSTNTLDWLCTASCCTSALLACVVSVTACECVSIYTSVFLYGFIDMSVLTQFGVFYGFVFVCWLAVVALSLKVRGQVAKRKALIAQVWQLLKTQLLINWCQRAPTISTQDYLVTRRLQQYVASFVFIW